MMWDTKKSVPNEFLCQDENNVSVYLKREDQIHPKISGNKFRKIKYNLAEAKNQGKTTLLTFGGAFSNHIAATAAAGRLANIRTIGIIRGEELGINREKTLRENPTLYFAASSGMQLEFISRSAYRTKASEEFIAELKEKFGDFYLLPEGGTNLLAIKGCEEILTEEDKNFDFICCPVGTGGTISGIINTASEEQKILGFPALKGDFLTAEIQKLTKKNNWELITKYHFNGYAKVNPDLIEFINNFKRDFGILLDPIYTGKMMYGIFDLIKKEVFLKNTRILAIHTGGLQGIEGMNRVLKNKNLPQINIYNEI